MTRRWTEADVGDQSGRVALVTGANSGIGFETARVLAEHGARVVLACRDREKAEDARQRILGSAPDAALAILDLDLADLDTVARAAGQFAGAHERLDLLVNNAGLMAIPHRRTVQGFEMQLGVNHLAAFALTGRLADRLLAAEGSRVVAVSSQGHRPGRIRFDDLQLERRYSPWQAYFQSKLANLLFTRELDRRLRTAGVSTKAVAAHPGGTRTNLGHENPGGVFNTVAHHSRPVIERVFLQSAAMGALPTLRAATDPDAEGGDYFGPDGFMEQRGHPKRVGCSTRARDDDAARRLWEVSEELTGVHFDGLRR
jgi:NAD(P)-dependent dehydrogenase (short-subunit alcohol dehydrogenase family)